jgi:CO/xanthine dehydrogenase Mo-binding subunit/CO/xanthine dehydrogenase FAD-binding subunit
MSVGARSRPLEWDELTLGQRPYTADLPEPDDLLHVAVVRSPHPFARVLSVDIDAAMRMPGVTGVLTAADFREGVTYAHRGGDFSDWPPLAAGVVLYVGQEVAAVAAETKAEAEAAARAVSVKYRPMRAVDTVQEARAPGAPALHERASGERNVASIWATEWGDVAAGRAAHTLSVRGSFRYPPVAHACMETNIVLAAWDPERELIELWTSTQAPYFIVKEVAHVLGLSEDQVVCREVSVGGGFGSKSKISTHEVLAAALARKTRRPALLQHTRDEEFSANKTRHEFHTTIETGVDQDGTIRFIEADIQANNGAFCHMGPSVLKVGAITLGSMYRPDGVSFEARLVDTNHLPGGPFRGYGTPQVSLAMESQVDELAALLDQDPIDLRLRNLRPEHEVALCGYRIGTSGLARCLLEARELSDWDQVRADRAPGVGIGIAAGMHGSGSYAYHHANRSDAAVDVLEDGSVRVRFGGADAGTGQRTILAQIAAGELTVPLARVSVQSIDSEATPFEMGAWSSRGTHMTGHAVAIAARKMRNELLDVAAKALGTSEVALRDGAAVSAGGRIELDGLVRMHPSALECVLTAEASFVDSSIEMMAPDRDQANLSPSYAFAAHVATVQVDARTGSVRLLDYVAAHDLGRPINPTLAEGQIIGGAAMGIGAALGEELIKEGGKLANGAYLNYALPRAGDLPPIRPAIVDVSEAAGPFGAKSVGEMSLIPAGAAVANAVADAIGVRIRSLPITPDKVLSALAEREGRRRSFRLWRRPSRWWIAAMRWLYPRGLHSVLHRYGTRVSKAVQPPAQLGDIAVPASLDSALTLRSAGAVPVGGATDLALQHRQGLQATTPLVSLADVPAASEVSSTQAGWRVGAAVTLTQLERMAQRELPALADAIRTIASPQTRNVATVAGNLAQKKRCWFYRNGFPCYKRSGPTSPCYAVLGDHRFQHAAVGAHRCQAVTPSDLATAFYALDAGVEIAGPAGPRVVGIDELFVGPGETCLAAEELILAVQIPRAALNRSFAFEKLGLFEGDFATASVALSAGSDGTHAWSDARVVLGAMAPVPLRLERVERTCEGQAVSPTNLRRAVDAELDRIAHPLPGNAWKLDAAAGLAEKAAERLAGRSG